MRGVVGVSRRALRPSAGPRRRVGALAVGLLMAGMVLVPVSGPAAAADVASSPMRPGGGTLLLGQPTGLNVDAQQGSLSVSVDWDDVAGADSYKVRWREGVRGTKLNEGISVTASRATITVADYGEWIVKVFACNGATCGRGKSARFQVEALPEPASDPTTETAPESTTEPAPEATPEPTVEIPAKPTGLEADTTAGSLEVLVDWDDVSGADDYRVRWRRHGPGQALNAGVSPTSSNETITVAGYGRWVVRVEACNTAGCSSPAAAGFTVETAPEPPAVKTVEVKGVTLKSEVSGQATATALVSNVGQTSVSTTALSTASMAQGFTTGNNTGGYTLESIEVHFTTTAPDSGITVQLATGLTSGSADMTVVATLTNPSTFGTGNVKFAAPDNTRLFRNTQYWVVLTGSSGQATTTNTNGQDTGAAAAWSIADNLFWRAADGTGNWSSEGDEVKIRVNGHAGPPSAKQVSNTGVGTESGGAISRDWQQKFTTGSNSAGYTLRRADVKVHTLGTAPTTYELELWSTGSGAAKLATFTKPTALAAGLNQFDLATPHSLTANTTYALVWDQTDAANTFKLSTLSADGEDSDSETGWSIANGAASRIANTTGAYGDIGDSLLIAVYGFAKDNTAPTVQSALLDRAAKTVKITFSEPVNPDLPAATRFQFQNSANSWVGSRASSASASGKVLTLVFPSIPDSAATIGYHGPDTKNIRDIFGNNVSAFKNTFTEVDTTSPTVTSATVNAAGTQMTVTFSEPLNNSPYQNVDWTYTVDGGSPRNVTSSTGIQNRNSANPHLIFQNLSPTITAGQVVKLNYSQNSNSALRIFDKANLQLASFTDFAVTNSSTVPGTTQQPSTPSTPTTQQPQDDDDRVQYPGPWFSPKVHRADVSGRTVTVIMDKPVALASGSTWAQLAGSFVVRVEGVRHYPNAASVVDNGRKLQLTMAAGFSAPGCPKMSVEYAKGHLVDAGDDERRQVETFGLYEPGTCVTPKPNATWISGHNVVLNMDKRVTLNSAYPQGSSAAAASFTVRVNRVRHTPDKVYVSGRNITLDMGAGFNPAAGAKLSVEYEHEAMDKPLIDTATGLYVSDFGIY